jgi:hypothetical protein
MYTIRQLNYFNSVYWDVVDENGHDVGLFGNPKTAQVFADNLNKGRPVSSIYDRMKGDDSYAGHSVKSST